MRNIGRQLALVALMATAFWGIQEHLRLTRQLSREQQRLEEATKTVARLEQALASRDRR